MDSPTTVERNGIALVNGHAPDGPVSIEDRLAALEARQQRFENALLAAGKFIFDNPASKMMLMALPKEAQIRLKEFFDGNR
jgi:hypothetical protein